MDINGIDVTYKAKPQFADKVNKDNEFRQIFDKKIAGINLAGAPVPPGGKADVLEHGDKILNLLDDYARDLGDSQKTLKHIGPLVETIEKEASLIQAEAADKVQNDSELEKFIKDLTVIANVAVFKFHRGDYI
jgi:formylmethanofuran dehydrogenase subunit E-like metal-binding protein